MSSADTRTQISQREYAEETVFWSLKYATEFSARRRTTMLFLANPSGGAPTAYRWVDNTPDVWAKLRHVLAAHDPKAIAVDIHPDISFSSGLHAGEFEALKRGIGSHWTARLVSNPMVAVEYIATMPASRAAWYRKLQSTAWAMITEAFSEAVITPGVTTTAVSVDPPIPPNPLLSVSPGMSNIANTKPTSPKNRT